LNDIARVLSTPWPGAYATHLDSALRFEKHWHDTFGIGVIERGAQRWFSGRGHVRGYEGDVITLNPGEIHDGAPLGAETRRWRILYLDEATMQPFGHGAAIGRPVIGDRALFSVFARLFRRLERWHISRSRTDALACEESLVHTCTHLMAVHGSAPFRPRVVNGDVRAVRERLSDDRAPVPTLDELGRLVGLSRYQVLRRFEKVYGVPPHAWLLRRRVERARVLIRGGATLATAAQQAGFADQSHMTRAFVRQFGFTPGAWRRATGSRMEPQGATSG
jgi:AraC-like DNA-binding protein